MTTTITHEEALHAARNNVLHLQLQLDTLPTEKEAAKREFNVDAVARLNAVAEVLPLQIAAARAEVLRLEIEADEAEIRSLEALASDQARDRAEKEAALRQAEAEAREATARHLNTLALAQAIKDGAREKRRDRSNLEKELGR
jgi:hypothetical protein